MMLNKKPTTAASSTTSTAQAVKPSGATNRSVTAPCAITSEQIARRAYEIFKSGTGGSTEENWYRAERELRARA